MSSIAAAAAVVGDESLRYFRVSIGEASRNKPGVIVREEECVTDCKLVGVKRDLRSASWSFAIRCRSSVFSMADFGILLKFRSASLETVAARSVVEFSVNPIELKSICEVYSLSSAACSKDGSYAIGRASRSACARILSRQSGS